MSNPLGLSVKDWADGVYCAKCSTFIKDDDLAYSSGVYYKCSACGHVGRSNPNRTQLGE